MSNNDMSGWLVEKSAMWPGQAMCVELDKILFEGKSDFQRVMVASTKTYGTMLVIDGVIQITERDEFAYQETIAHIPLLSHPNPKKVCIIGGGDGGVISQAIKHKSVEEIHLCEIDKMVVEASKKFFPKFAPMFDNPRVTVKIGDGLKYLSDLTEPTYDVIIVDSSDPVGPAESLFGRAFYESAKKALLPGGIICAQSECMWLHLDLIKELKQTAKELFPSVEYAYTCIPTYPCGQIGFLISSLGGSCKKPRRTVKEALIEEEVETLRYYTEQIHEAAFVLPRFAQHLQD
eukprot:TRINITY_DN811_c0_g1_i1.p1 TRINITY_DN811_c0_g1~~TRINITY_DN811_c0_g1_i1.p1  ORF type:complete len:290 (-),score=73.22 TRINITY_DN811_c0_g1_i1:236-1105(-)